MTALSGQTAFLETLVEADIQALSKTKNVTNFPARSQAKKFSYTTNTKETKETKETKACYDGSKIL